MVVVRSGKSLTLVNTLRLDKFGLERLDTLGTVENIVKLGSFHGRDDAFYIDRYGAPFWAPQGMTHERGVQTDKELTPCSAGPIPDATVFSFETADVPEATGLAGWIGGAISLLAFLPMFLFLLGIFIVIVLLGELASNTAVAAIFLPVAGASAAGLGVEPSLLVMSVALAATIGFMTAGRHTAIVFGSGILKVSDMLKAGALLDVITILVVVILALTLGPKLFANF